ncbi:DNA mismatch repair protein MutT [Jannaschia pagri]|uniref:DNA mismatch repair protein MutT n=1 Tax=Jannaschia pagri TaxID=2829797 RepID=A0ABQ4NJA9_9RHOB|nr:MULTISPECIES: NUDIX domain-containing protein [unclassified Jannaschia]GIT90675.1 DNA mismatch repair protein MutT [Jannaschia sp. AI_61]GIT94507.1 DNA mismatch repair protein MutT [Jannaschia sp. AI_62]
MNETPKDKTALRDAASIILLRDGSAGPCVLMGQRGAEAAFMPNKFVFPGGAVDQSDGDVSFARPLRPDVGQALAGQSTRTPEALAAAALRELAEETGQVIGIPSEGAAPWPGFAGYGPDGDPLTFVFRAITPPGRPRRFDARFFLAPASAVVTELDDFSAAEDELSHLQWVPLAEARALDMPFITEVVLAEVAAIAEGRDVPGVPFFDNSGDTSVFRRL